MIQSKFMIELVYAAFCKQTSIYPPTVLVGPTTKQKDEQRIIQGCEPLYSFSNTLLSETRQAYFDIEVSYLFAENIKLPYLAKVIGKFAALVELAYKQMKVVYSKDPILKEYFATAFPDRMEEYSTVVFHLMMQDTGGSQECIDAFRAEYKEVQAAMRKRTAK